MALIFLILRVHVILQMFQIQFMIGNRGLKFLLYPHHFTIAQSREISSQTPKCANMALAGTNAYKTVGNRRVILQRALTFYFICRDTNL